MRCASNDLSDAQSLIARFEQLELQNERLLRQYRFCSDPDLFWFTQTHADAPWTAHLIGHIGNGPIAQHDAPAP